VSPVDISRPGRRDATLGVAALALSLATIAAAAGIWWQSQAEPSFWMQRRVRSAHSVAFTVGIAAVAVGVVNVVARERTRRRGPEGRRWPARQASGTAIFVAFALLGWGPSPYPRYQLALASGAVLGVLSVAVAGGGVRRGPTRAFLAAGCAVALCASVGALAYPAARHSAPPRDQVDWMVAHDYPTIGRFVSRRDLGGVLDGRARDATAVASACRKLRAVGVGLLTAPPAPASIRADVEQVSHDLAAVAERCGVERHTVTQEQMTAWVTEAVTTDAGRHLDDAFG
jgi:hypothetical protein